MGSIIGIEVYPMISLAIFFLFFVAVVYWAVKVDKKRIAEVSNLPLED